MRTTLLVCAALLALPLAAIGEVHNLEQQLVLGIGSGPPGSARSTWQLSFLLQATPATCPASWAVLAAASPACHLVGKVALVTGASTGIGRRLADRLVEGGMIVVGTSRTPDTYLSAANCTYNNPGDVCAPSGFELWQLDQTFEESVAQLVQQVQQAYGAVHLLVLNAGRNFYGDMVNSDLGSMQQSLDTNF
ncbi:hypothetical protein ABPG75_005963 [Micractinium tetrahymenae]